MQLITTCGVILLTNDNEVLLLRRSETDKHRPLEWDLPGGHVEPGESFETTAKRELYEETGISVDISSQALVFAISDTFPERDLSVNWLFFAAKMGADVPVVLSAEHDNYEWVDRQEALTRVTHPPKQKALLHVFSNSLGTA
jgi:8-oxo-dGTP diphosphatase